MAIIAEPALSQASDIILGNFFLYGFAKQVVLEVVAAVALPVVVVAVEGSQGSQRFFWA